MVKIGVNLRKLSQNENWGITFWTTLYIVDGQDFSSVRVT